MCNGLERLEGRVFLDAGPLPSFTWRMEDRYGVDLNRNGLFDLPNSRGYAAPKGFGVELDGSGTQSEGVIRQYQWTVSGAGLKKPVVVRGATAVKRVGLPEGTFNVELKVTDAGKG